MHTELYGPAMELLEQPKGTPAQQLTCAILEGCRALDESGLCRFWEQDAPEILCAIPSEERRAQQEQEYAVFRRFLVQNKAADIPEEQAMNALRSLILTVPCVKSWARIIRRYCYGWPRASVHRFLVEVCHEESWHFYAPES